MRSWIVWISLLLLAASLGWFWLLSRDLALSRIDHPDPKPATPEVNKPAINPPKR